MDPTTTSYAEAVQYDSFEYRPEHSDKHVKTILKNVKKSDRFFVRSNGTIGKCHYIVKFLMRFFTFGGCGNKAHTFDNVKVLENLDAFTGNRDQDNSPLIKNLVKIQKMLFGYDMNEEVDPEVIASNKEEADEYNELFHHDDYDDHDTSLLKGPLDAHDPDQVTEIV